jgi:hypothetical protein
MNGKEMKKTFRLRGIDREKLKLKFNRGIYNGGHMKAVDGE